MQPLPRGVVCPLGELIGYHIFFQIRVDIYHYTEMLQN